MTEYFPVMYVPMPLNANGDGPADSVDTVSVAHEVWDTETNVTICTAKDEATANLIVGAWNLRTQAPDSWRPTRGQVINAICNASPFGPDYKHPDLLRMSDAILALRPQTAESGK